jgi:LysM repeat protein/predicted nucleic acid-binding protein
MPCRFSLWILLVGLAISGCGSTLQATPPAPSATAGRLTPYWTATASMVSPTITPVVVIPLTPAPSATPFVHVVTRGETLLGIALQYGVTLEALQAANPDVDPQFLSVDTDLIIPLGDEIQVISPTPTAVMVEWTAPVCYRSGDGGAWCFLPVENNRQAALENLSAWIGLYDIDGGIVASQVAVGPVNILRPGQAMPMVAFFAPPLPVEIVARGELLSAVEISEQGDRYLDWQLESLAIEVVGESGNAARVTGSLAKPEGSSLPGQVWIAAVAYDQQGLVVGLRKWEGTGELEFEMLVYSLGGAIDRVEILTEIRP